MTNRADHLNACRRLHRLRDQRREMARAALAAAARAVAEARLERDRRRAVVAERSQALAEHRVWFSGPNAEARLLSMALARLDLLIEQVTEAEADLAAAETALDAAEAARADAARAFARAEAKRHAAEVQLTAALHRRNHRIEVAEEAENEARSSRGVHP